MLQIIVQCSVISFVEIFKLIMSLNISTKLIEKHEKHINSPSNHIFLQWNKEYTQQWLAYNFY